MTAYPAVAVTPSTRTEETPPWHPYCGCQGCRAGDWIGRRAVERIAQREAKS